MSRTYNDITGAELLRADSCSQKIYVSDNAGNYQSLVNKSQFWGDGSSNNRLYYDYQEQSNSGWAVQQDGWNDYTQDEARHLNPTQTEEWINNKVFCNNISTLSVIQGYAGCGKTIFINSQLQKRTQREELANYYDVYVDYDNNAAENGYIPSAIRNHAIAIMLAFLIRDDGLDIYEKFINLLTEYSVYSAAFSDLLPMFRKNGEISTLAKQIFDNRGEMEKVQSLETEFRVQFISGTMAIAGAFKGKIGNDSLTLNDFTSIKEQYIKTLLEYYLIIDFILIFAVNTIRNKSTQIIFYDNLDIIDNPQHIAFFINKLQEVLHKISKCFNKNHSTPVFNVIVAVRKITYALISSFSEVRDNERGFGDVRVNFLDISNLYSSTQLLKHKAQVLMNNFQDYIPDEYNRTDVKKFLVALINIPEETLKEICLPDLFNHNIRACANILERSMKHSSNIVPKKVNIKKMPNRCNSAIWINSICAVLQENGIWSNLGYNTNDKENINYPTTLSRLILTYLYNKRRKSRERERGYETVEVSFEEIIQVFEKLPFFSFSGNAKNMAEYAEKNYSANDTRLKIINALSNMIKRNMESDGINPKNEMELWRRPIYFTKNAFSLTDSNGEDNVQNELNKQMKCFKQHNAYITDFCITDEGYTFIEKIATNFEFYSVRYNGCRSIPLCYLINTNELDTMISNVYTQVQKCINNHQWLMGFYIRKYGKSHNNTSHHDYKNDVNDYCQQKFHPRTDGQKPQLHIVRTIYDHIFYLNDYRDYLIGIGHENLRELNKCLVKWIGRYLELYRKNLYQLLDNTEVSFNEVFLDLKYLYYCIYSSDDLLHCFEGKIISISRNDSIRKKGKACVSDERLKNESMLID